jgi:guanine deaminase
MPKTPEPSHDLMNQAIEQARKTMNSDIGGPFGALIVDEKGTVVAVSSNSVLQDHDPTAHAEINAIRQAGKILGTHDLSKYTLYTTAYPCPMCMGAILWANIKKVVYGCRPEDADAIGFRDDFMYRFIQSGCHEESLLSISEKHRSDCLKLFAEYHAKEKKLY